MKADPRASLPFRAFAALGVVGLCSLACTGMVSSSDGPGGAGGPNGSSGALGQTGGGSSVGAGTSAGGASGGSGVILANGGPKLRVLTQAEYKNAVADLLGPISAPLVLPDDTFIAGFTAIGGAEVAINSSTVDIYETASRAATAEVFADATRWQKLVGCQPKADLSDACVVTFIQTFGKRAFRRDLTDAEVQEWLQVGKDVAGFATSAAQGLAAVTSGLIQSPNFLYRVETNKLDASTQRLKYDGPSMATRLAFL
ncbi:MAG: DUF1595 domain-containing protein, partial [Polyangiaceae bacterium]